LKKILTFIVILLPWFLSSILVNSNNAYYQNLNLPFFAPPAIVFTIIWTILYILIAISIYKIYKEYKCKDIGEYNKTLALNYLFNQLFSYVFFSLKSPFLGFIVAIIVLITSLFLYYETKKLNDTSSKLLVPYVIWNIFATILSLTIYFMNF
jgi:tryptophan-rich sensory protein